MRVREKIGPVAAFRKILRATMRNVADSESYTVPATIDEPLILDEIEQSLKALGYAGA
jgi:propionyl-CoA synthetase